MRLITTCLRWELAEQPPLVVEIKSIRSDGCYLVITHPDGHEEKLSTDHEMVHRVIA